MGNFLYINSRGIPHTKHSYSAGNIWEQSPYKYYLQKVLGWKEHDNKCRFMFGRALEESIQFYHEHSDQDPVEDFKTRWSVHKGVNLSYTDVEKDWDTCLKMGVDMIKLYQATQPSLPIPLGGHSVFQREYSKEVFPGDPNYGGIEDAGKLDIVCYVDSKHPMLAPVEWKPEYGPLRAVIVDIKTAATEFPEQPGMAGYDAQLRRYSWLTGIRDVSLLWFRKTGLGFKKGYPATLLKSTGVFSAGAGCVIAKIDGEDIWVVNTDFMVDEMERVQGKKGDKLDQTDIAEQRRDNWLDTYGTKVKSDQLTRQTLQFNTGIVLKQSADDAGAQAGRQIVDIVNAWKTNRYPNTFGIRYPRDDRNDAYFRAFVLGDKAFRDQNFTKSGTDKLFEEGTDV